METAGAPSNVVEMPKFVITKFDVTPQYWLRFWGQFETDWQVICSRSNKVFVFERIAGFEGPKSDRRTSVHSRRLSCDQKAKDLRAMEQVVFYTVPGSAGEIDIE